MLTFTIDPTSSVTPATCQTCCCQSANISPGSTEKWALMYAKWTTPIGGRGLTINASFDIQNKTTAPTALSNAPPVPTLFLGSTPRNVALVSTVLAVDTDPLVFALLPLYGPTNGVITMAANGAFTYTPNGSFMGYEHIFFTASDGSNKPVVGEMVIAVQPLPTDLTAAPVPVPTSLNATPVISIKPKNVKVNSPWQSLTFPIEVSPQAKVGDVYRLMVQAQSVDCDCVSYTRTDCFDLVVSSCG